MRHREVMYIVPDRIASGGGRFELMGLTPHPYHFTSLFKLCIDLFLWFSKVSCALWRLKCLGGRKSDLLFNHSFIPQNGWCIMDGHVYLMSRHVLKLYEEEYHTIRIFNELTGDREEKPINKLVYSGR